MPRAMGSRYGPDRQSLTPAPQAHGPRCFAEQAKGGRALTRHERQAEPTQADEIAHYDANKEYDSSDLHPEQARCHLTERRHAQRRHGRFLNVFRRHEGRIRRGCCRLRRPLRDRGNDGPHGKRAIHRCHRHRDECPARQPARRSDRWHYPEHDSSRKQEPVPQRRRPASRRPADHKRHHGHDHCGRGSAGACKDPGPIETQPVPSRIVPDHVHDRPPLGGRLPPRAFCCFASAKSRSSRPTVTRLQSLGALKIRCPQGRVGSSPSSGICSDSAK